MTTRRICLARVTEWVNGMARKATEGQMRKRIEEVLRLRLDGAEFWDLRDYIRKQEITPGSAWELRGDDKPLSDQHIRRYITDTNKMIVRHDRGSKEEMLDEHVARRRHLYAKAIKSGDLSNAVKALDSEAKLQGLFPPPPPPAEFVSLLKEIESLQSIIRGLMKNDSATPDAVIPEAASEGVKRVPGEVATESAEDE